MTTKKSENITHKRSHTKLQTHKRSHTTLQTHKHTSKIKKITQTDHT